MAERLSPDVSGVSSGLSRHQISGLPLTLKGTQMPLPKFKEMKRAYTEPIARANTMALAAIFIAVAALIYAMGAFRHGN